MKNKPFDEQLMELLRSDTPEIDELRMLCDECFETLFPINNPDLCE